MDKYERLSDIIKLSTELNTVQDLDMLLEKILFNARTFTNADAGSIQIKDGDELVFSHVQTESLQRKLPPGQKLIYTTFKTKIDKSSLSGYAAVTGEILNIPDAYAIPEGVPYRFNPTNDGKSGYKTTSVLTVPLVNNRGEVLGVMQMINATGKNGAVKPFDPEDELYVLHFASSASMILQRAQMTRALILRMIGMAELRDPKETGSHVNRVAAYSTEIYEKWAITKKVPREEIDKNRDVLRMAAMLHDVGKVAISDVILKKPAKFTDEEFAIMKTHTYQGARLFMNKQSEFDEISSQVALTHHENWDGTGYPGRVNVDTGEPVEADSAGRPMPLKGEEIPLYGRIVAVADVFDALSSQRVYKESWKEEDVLKEMKIMSGKKFDPELVDVFFDSLDIIRSISSRYPDRG
ncbi:MAG: HD domain-containing protein [Spirochaetes bacterium]|jgi:HD-GYP domain-containing protein (c-di-GMP phosphodiesterase class II)|nr:HD domain-containing protein [Spirochaetota bacterium]